MPTAGSITPVADLSAVVQTHPVANPDADDFEPDGTWYGLVAMRGDFHATEPNHQKLDRITPDGHIIRVVHLSTRWVAPANWQGPTGIVDHCTTIVDTLGSFPVRPGTQTLYTITPSGQVAAVASVLTTVLGVAFDARGRLYALQTDTVAGFPGPVAGSGQVVRMNDDGALTTIGSGLTFPTALTVGADGALYVANIGFGVPVPGAGQIVRIEVPM